MHAEDFEDEEPTATITRANETDADRVCAEWMRLARERAARRASAESSTAAA